MNNLKNQQISVLQEWVSHLPLREQGTLLTAVRGCDLEPKQWTSTGIAVSQGRLLTAYIRWCFMVPADPREVKVRGAFMQDRPPKPFKPAEFGHLPQHWYAHVMHALQVVGHRHPQVAIAEKCQELYRAMAENLHLNPERTEQFMNRLSEDRIANKSVPAEITLNNQPSTLNHFP